MPDQRPHSSDLRRGRFSEPGTFYFLTSCTDKRRNIFSIPEHAQTVLESVRWLHSTNQFFVDAACVMPDHVHFVGQLREKSLSQVMHTLESYSAHKIGMRGIRLPVWQNGYHDHALRSDEDYRSLVVYLLQNPVRGGLVKRMEDYRFLILPEWWTGELDFD
jgi:REP element-mobilizing transposase RayT